MQRTTRLISMAAFVLLAGTALALALWPAPERPLGSFATSLQGRTRSQCFNAVRAARAIDGVVLQPGEVLSFNGRVGPWNAAGGYRKAAVSYDGEMVRSFGGGVCQTSTTLYNAALLAGLRIVEHHSHVRPPAYAPPGRDAAVAVPSVDLKLQNPYPKPVTLRARRVGEKLVVSVQGSGPVRRVAVRTELQGVGAPPEVRGVGVTNHGWPGFTATTEVSSGSRSEVVSRESYAPITRLSP